MTAYPRMVEILQLLGSSSLMITADRGGLQRPAGAGTSSSTSRPTQHRRRDRVKLFHLAWDIACSSFGSRQVLYERFFASDPLTRARALAAIYPKNEATERVLDFLQRDDTHSHGGHAMTYRPKHLGHVNLYVRNAERSRQWYEDVLGLHTYHFRPGRAAFMSADKEKSHEVALMEVGDDAPLQAKRQVGLNHLAFMMETLDDLKDAYYRLKEKGVKFDHISDHGLSLGHLFPRSGRQRAGSVLRAAAREVAAAGQRVRARRGEPRAVPRPVGGGDGEAARRRTCAITSSSRGASSQ